MSLKKINHFFKNRNWKPFPFQKEMWEAYLKGHSGLLHVPTGSGKTYAATMGAFAKFLERPEKKGLKVLYLTPLRALTRDLEAALKEPIAQEGWPIKIESRTGDTSASVKKKQLKNPPDLLLTTPESLAILISQPDADDILKHVELVILDEWHELMASKRGSLIELGLSYLRSLNPEMQTWALSASIGNLEQAAQVAVGPREIPKIISGGTVRELDVECLLPPKIDGFPWAGHLGFRLKNALLETLNPQESTLIFTNTRSQAERWYETLRQSRPEMQDELALHHSSMDSEERELVEAGVKVGDIKWVVCTSSLDLGVDFQPVERVVQIGSPKMVARLLQRAGRSAHRPGGKSRLLFVPTNSWEIVELEAVKRSLSAGIIESRPPIHKPIDVLLQHMTTLACGPGFRMDELWLSLKETYSFSSITREELNWCLKFLTQGGETLKTYSQFHKIIYDEEAGRYRLTNSRMATLHRMSIGTIVSRESVKVCYANRKKIGSVEENFISRFKKGDVFQFAGKKLELIMIKDMTAYVKASQRQTNTIPSWDGGRFALSETLSESFRDVLSDKSHPIQSFLKPLIEAQEKLSILPDKNVLLIEKWSSKEGEHLFVFPFEGRSVHEGLSQLWAHRFAKREPATFSFSVSEYGFEIMGPVDYDFEALFDDNFFSEENLEIEINESVQLGSLTQRQFREIASIAGLVFSGYPGSLKTGRQMQVSSSLLYEVFKKYEPNNLLIRQSYEEVLTGALESERMKKTLRRLARMKVMWQSLTYPSPLSFPLFFSMTNGNHLSNETLEMKVARLKKSWQKKDDAQSLQ